MATKEVEVFRVHEDRSSHCHVSKEYSGCAFSSCFCAYNHEQCLKHGQHGVWCLEGRCVSEIDLGTIWSCPMDRLPLFVNTDLAPIAKIRFERGY